MEVIRRPFIAVRLVPARRLASTRPNLAPLPIESEPIPTHAPPAPWQRGAQALGFVLAGSKTPLLTTATFLQAEADMLPSAHQLLVSTLSYSMISSKKTIASYR